MDSLSRSEIEVRLVEAPSQAVDELLTRHHELMRSQSPEESCHVMTAQALREAGALLFALHLPDGTTAGVGALKSIGDGAMELKSMHTLAEHRGKGLGRIMLDKLLAEAQSRGAQTIWLETGSAPEFAAARGLYEAAGFEYCPPFGNYTTDPLSAFMKRSLFQ